MGANEPQFESRYGAGKIDSAHWLAEEMCRRRAASLGQTLAQFFWRNRGHWAELHYRAQMRDARALLRQYPLKALGHALRTREGQRIYSLGAPWLDQMLKDWVRADAQRQAVREMEEVERPAAPAPVSSGSFVRPALPAASLANKLRGL